MIVHLLSSFVTEKFFQDVLLKNVLILGRFATVRGVKIEPVRSCSFVNGNYSPDSTDPRHFLQNLQEFFLKQTNISGMLFYQ